MVYCAGKLMENLKSFYKSNRPHFLWVYRPDNPLGVLVFSQHPARVITPVKPIEKGGLLLNYSPLE